MQIPSTSTAYGGGEAQRLLSLLLQRQAGGPGQDLPSSTPAADPSAAPAPPSGGGPSGAQFASATLASLLSTQETQPTNADIANQVISAADKDGDGSLSLDEVSAALGKDPTSGPGQLAGAFAQLDTNGDGKISADELTNALNAKTAQNGQVAGGTQHAHHHHHHAKASSADMAAQILDAADTNGDGKLSADEITNALGSGSGAQTDGLSQALSKLDTNGDGQLDASELGAAIDAFRSAHRNGATQTASTSQPQTAQPVIA